MRQEIKVSISSKLGHALKLAAIKEDGFHINSRWIRLEAARATDRLRPVTHWLDENFDDIEMAYYHILYVEPGDHLKTALIEVGVALRANKFVWIAGDGHGLEVPLPGGNPGDTITLPHRDVLPWGKFAKQIRLVSSLANAFKEMRSINSAPIKNSEGVLSVVPKFATLGSDNS
jgi:hypothetical protein